MAAVLGATFEHASNLASFVFLYKLVLAAGRAAWRMLQLPLDDRPGHPAVGWHAFVAGCIGASPKGGRPLPLPPLGLCVRVRARARVRVRVRVMAAPNAPWAALSAGGFVVWGKPTAVNQQIVMYLLSRIIIATIKTLASRKVQPFCSVTEHQVCALSRTACIERRGGVACSTRPYDVRPRCVCPRVCLSACAGRPSPTSPCWFGASSCTCLSNTDGSCTPPCAPP